MPASSAGILMYRRRGKAIEVLLVHPGGPFWRKKDAGAWSIPKGEIEPDEDPADVAQREFREELGSSAGQPLRSLGEIRQRGGKIVIAFAVEGNLDAEAIEQHLRNGMAAEKRSTTTVSGGRSCGMVRSEARESEDSRQPATPSRSAR
jgi:predicted NUDIX family NTP pyrophosphohydrolase